MSPLSELRVLQARVVDRIPMTPWQAACLNRTERRANEPGLDIQQVSITVHHALDPALYVYAWYTVMERHPALRSRFRWDRHHMPVQEVLDAVELPVSRADWRALDDQALRAHLQALAYRERTEGFDPMEAPLMRLHLARIGDLSWNILWTFHHLLLDGRAIDTLLKESFEVHDGLRHRREVALAPAPLFRPEAGPDPDLDEQAARAHWARLLSGASCPSPLGIDLPPAAAAQAPADCLWGARQTALPEADTQRLRQRADEAGVGLSTLLLAAWGLLLSRYGDSHDVVFGVTHSLRHRLPQPQREACAHLINTLPMRMQLDAQQPVDEWLPSIRQQQLAARPHDHLPIAEIESLLSVPDGSTLFDTVVVYEHRSLTQRMRSLGGVWESRHVDHVGQTGVALTLVAHGDPQLLLRLEYDRRRFSDGVMARMLGHLALVLEGLASDRYERVGQLPWVTAAERQDLIGEPPADLPTVEPLHRRFDAQVQRAPHAPALTVRDTLGRRAEWSYRQLDTLSTALARQLHQAGVAPRQVVGLRCQPSVDLAVATLAILKAGGAVLPLDLSQPRERAAFMLEDADVRVVVCSKAWAAEWSDADVLTVVVVDVDTEAAASEDSGPGHAAADASRRAAVATDLAYVIYTSGESGVPKGVAVSHATIGRLLDRTQPLYGFDERDVWGLSHPFSLPVAGWEMWGAWSCGGRLLCVPPDRGAAAEPWHRWLCEERVTVLHQTPSDFYRLMDAACAGEPWPLSLRCLFLGGEALDISRLGSWFDRYGDARPQLVNVFGSLESGLHVTARPLQRADVEGAIGSVIGEPQSGQRVYLINESGELVPRGVPGELAVAVSDAATDYLNRPALSAQRFVPDPFSGIPGWRLCMTGDWARWLDNGDLEYLGRRDRQVKHSGFRAEPAEIEALLRRHPHVRQAAVVAAPLASGGCQLNAYVVPALLGRGVPEGAPEPELASQLRGYLQRWLPAALIPAHFVCLDELPLGDDGQPDLRLLPSPHERRIERGPHSAPTELGGFAAHEPHVGEAPMAPATVEGWRGEALSAPAPASVSMVPAPGRPWFIADARTANDLCSLVWSVDVLLPVSAGQIQSACAWLAGQHPMLRQRFPVPDAGEHPWPTADLEPAAVVVVHVSHQDDVAITRLLEERIAEARAGLSLANGPVARWMFIDKGPLRLASLVLVAHRRAVDEWSWPVLRDDLERALMALRQGQSLAELVSSVEVQPQQRTRELQAAAQAPAVYAELGAWQARARRAAWRVPPPPLPAGASAAVAETTSRWLSMELVRAWCESTALSDSARACSIWLGALTNALHQLTGLTAWRVDLLGHGRSPVAGSTALPERMIRAVGGWSHPFPWTLTTAGGGTVTAMAQAVAADMSGLVQGGLGYALLRWLHPDDAVRQMLAEAPAAPLLFVPPAAHGAALADEARPLLRERINADGVGAWPLAPSGHPLVLRCVMTAKGLQLQAVWDPSQVDRGWVERLLAYWLGGLQAGPQGHSVEVPDEPAQAALTSAQETLWAQSRHAPSLGFHQWQFDVHGPLQVERLREAFQWLVSHHAPLRWTFTGDANGPVVVQRPDSEALGLPWRQDDWRSMPPEVQRTALRQGLKADRDEPLPTGRPPLLRLWLIRLQDERWRLVWSVHALILDRWSRAPLVAALSTAYAAPCGQRPPDEPQAMPVLDAAEGWLRQWERQHAADARNHWTRQWQAAEAACLPRHPLPGAVDPGGPLHSAYRQLAADVALALAARAHQWRLAPSTLMLAAWAAVDAHRSSTMDTMVGCELSGRPGSWGAAAPLIGPWAQQVPVMVTVQPAQTLLQWLGQLQTQLTQAEQFQFLGLDAICGLSSSAAQTRPFDALLVFEGVSEDTGAQRLGDHAQIELVDQFATTGHPMTVVVRVDNLGWHLQAHVDAQAHAQGWDGPALVRRLHEVVFLLERLATAAGHESVGDWMQQLPAQPAVSSEASLPLAPR